MLSRNRNAWFYESYLTAFFTGFAAWREAETRTRLLGGTAEQDEDVLRREYDDLLRGTDMRIDLPLWTSVCKYEGGSLLDKTTLEVVHEYHRWGYVPVDMEGNPPDYIGQLYRFCCYLRACAQHEEDALRPTEEYADALDRFVSTYLLDTAQTVADGILAHAKSAPLRAAAALMLRLLGGDVPQAGNADETSYVCREAVRTGRNAAIPDGEARTVMTAGRNNCGGKCSIRATVQDGCVIDLDTGCDIGEPTLRACVRGRGYRKTYLSGQRLRYPMRRIGERGEGKFERISWEEAEDIIAREWKRIKEQYGVGSRYVNYGIGVSAVMRPDFMVKRLLALDGGFLSFFGSYSFACTAYVTPFIYGDKFAGNSVEDTLNARLILLWGHNPAETNFGSQRNYLMMQAKEKGARIVVIDPRKSDSVLALADEWVGVRPSTDGALCDAMAYVIYQNGLQDQAFMDKYCVGFDEDHMPDGVPRELNYHNYLFGGLDGVEKTPAWASEITGVPAETIERLAVEYATTKPACIMPGFGNQRIRNGEQTVRGMAALCCLTGNVGVPGGSAGGAPMVREEPAPTYPQGKNPYPGSISCFLWAQAIERGAQMTAKEDNVKGMDRLESDVKLLFSLASNLLANQHANINNSARILKDTGKCELLVCSDVFMTASAKFADLLLPAPSFLEDNNITMPWRSGHYLLCNNRVIEPLFGCKTEYDWVGEVAKRLGLYEAWADGKVSQEEWLEELYDETRLKLPELPEYAEFQRNGGYAYKNPKTYIAYEDQIRDPEHHPFATPSGKIEICSRQLYDMGNPAEIPAIPCYTPCAEGPADPLREKYPLQFSGWHTKRRCHSIHDNNPWMEEVEPQRLWMHPTDAKARGISDEDTVEVFNDRGRMRVRVRVTDRVLPGCVAAPEGAWYTPDENGVDTRGCINVLTSSRPTPLAKGNGDHTNLVQVIRADKQ